MLFLQRKKEYYLFVQLQEHWFSYVNTCLILFVAQSTKSFILLFKKKSFAVQLQGISARWAHAAALLVLLRIEYYSFHPSRAASSLLRGKHFPKGLIHEKKKKPSAALLGPADSCVSYALLLPQEVIPSSLMAALGVWARV